MEFELRYGKIGPPGARAWRARTVVDDVLGLRLEASYLGYLTARYVSVLQALTLDALGVEVGELEEPAPRVAVGKDAALNALIDFEVGMAENGPDVGRELFISSLSRFIFFGASGLAVDQPKDRKVVRAANGIRRTFTTAVEQAQSGRLAQELAPFLADVRRTGERRVDITPPTLPALAAWALQEALSRGPVIVKGCENCGLPWLAEGETARYCKRPAPGQVATCRNIADFRNFVGRNEAWHNERKRVYERMRRGTVAQDDYYAWLDTNRPGRKGETWVEFEEWREAKANA